MALGLSTETGGDFLPIIKFDARAGRYTRRDRVEEGGQFVTREHDITNGFAAIMDLENIEVGWMDFSGAAPSFAMNKLSECLPARPSEAHRQGFRIILKLKSDLGGDVREWASNAKVVIRSVDALHDAYKAAPEASEGKLPIVALTGTTIVETSSPKGTSRNYAPNLEIVGWVDRPADLHAASANTGTAADTSPETKPAAPATGSQAVPPPQQQTVATATVADFG